MGFGVGLATPRKASKKAMLQGGRLPAQQPSPHGVPSHVCPNASSSSGLGKFPWLHWGTLQAPEADLLGLIGVEHMATGAPVSGPGQGGWAVGQSQATARGREAHGTAVCTLAVEFPAWPASMAAGSAFSTVQLAVRDGRQVAALTGAPGLWPQDGNKLFQQMECVWDPDVPQLKCE